MSSNQKNQKPKSGDKKKGGFLSKVFGKSSGSSKPEQRKVEEKPKPKSRQGGNKPQNSGNRVNRGSVKTENSQLKTNDSAILQFGPIASEFLRSEVLGKKKITAEYSHDTNTWEKITFSFATLKEGGVSFGETIILSKDEYMAQRAKLVLAPGNRPKWLSFVAALFRVQLDITKSEPQVDPKRIFQFIKDNLTPIENVVVNLKQEEYDAVDSKNLAPALKSEYDKIKSHYPNGDREKYLNGIISGTMTFIPKVDWTKYHMAPYNKASVLKEFRVKNDINEDIMTRVANFSKKFDGDETIDSTGAGQATASSNGDE